MTLMKLVNSATKFRHGMDKFYQPNSGLGSSRSLHEAIYTYVCVCVCICIKVCACVGVHAQYMYIITTAETRVEQKC